MTETRTEEVSDFAVLQSIVKYVIVLSSIPVLSFFLSKLLFDNVLGLAPTHSSVYSAVVAIVVLHIALGHYIYKAYSEADKAPKTNKSD